jgi:hypothetical protein
MDMEPTYIIAGLLRRDYLLPSRGRPLIDAPGGSLLYATAGLGIWDNSIGMLARAGEDYPHEWLKGFEKRGWDRRGIQILPETLDLRYFQATLEGGEVQHTNPVAHFARLGLTFPKSLLGYQPPVDSDSRRKAADPASPRPTHIPHEYLNARAVHLCPMDFISSSRLSSTFRQANVTSLTMDPSGSFMNSRDLEDVHTLIQGLTAFLPSEEELRSLFWGRTDDPWQMADDLGAHRCEFIVIKRGARGQWMYDSVSRRRWEVPAYAALVDDPTGAGGAFCGGFLAGYQQTFDPLQALLYGNVSASLAIEGRGAFHALEALPGLAQARLKSLAGVVRQV